MQHLDGKILPYILQSKVFVTLKWPLVCWGTTRGLRQQPEWSNLYLVGLVLWFPMEWLEGLVIPTRPSGTLSLLTNASLVSRIKSWSHHIKSNKNYTSFPIAVVVEWELSVVTVPENSPTSLCAVVVNPQVNIQESVQVDVFSVNATAKGKQT